MNKIQPLKSLEKMILAKIKRFEHNIKLDQKIIKKFKHIVNQPNYKHFDPITESYIDSYTCLKFQNVLDITSDIDSLLEYRQYFDITIVNDIIIKLENEIIELKRENLNKLAANAKHLLKILKSLYKTNHDMDTVEQLYHNYLVQCSKLNTFSLSVTSLGDIYKEVLDVFFFKISHKKWE